MIDNKKLKKKQEAIYKKQKKEIEKVYIELASIINKEIERVNDFSENDLKKLNKTLKSEVKNKGKDIQVIIKNNIEAIVTATIISHNSFYKYIDKKHNTNTLDVYKKQKEDIIKEVTNKVIKGGTYKDNITLSKRIWGNDKKIIQSIDRIINEGIKNKRNPIDIAKDLEKYVNPKVHKDVDLYKMYPGISGKVEANALRLARTSVTHAHQIATSESVKRNPILTHVQYNASNSSRTCEMCADRDGTIYKYDDFPLDHPNGKCFMTAYIPNNIDDLIVEYIKDNILD